jgi:hypothetical protein
VAEAMDAHDFLDKVGLAVDISAPTRGDHLPDFAAAGDLETEIDQDLALLLRSYRDAAERQDTGRTEGDFLRCGRNGSGGGHWYVRLGRDGGSVGEGLAERPSLTLHFANPDAFCSLFTLQRTPMQGLLTGQVFGWPNIPLAFKLPYLFTPT